jgi:uncharacterized membrane protein YccF (DUF307 family)
LSSYQRRFITHRVPRPWRPLEKERLVALLRLIANIIWLILIGLPLAIGYAVAGVLACLLIITIPFGIASFRLAVYALWPFGQTVADDPGAGAASLIGNILWFLVAGWWLALGHIALAAGLFISIIGIPFGIAALKMAYLAVFPLGKVIVPVTAAPVRESKLAHSA